MKPGLAVGHSFEFTVRITDEMRSQFEGQVIHSVYSTAAMLNHMEWAARQHVLPYLESDEESVGYHIDLTHQAPAPMDALVRIRSTVTQAGRAKVVSQVEAWWNDTQLGQGRLTQAIVPLHKVQIWASEPQSQAAEERGLAILRAQQGKQSVGLKLLGWENGQSACTRYDEWLMVRLCLQQNPDGCTQDAIFIEAPCLLHYEVEELIAALRAMASGDQAEYQSDFLEGILSLLVSANGASAWIVRVAIQDSPALQAPILYSFPVSSAALLEWADAIQVQWEAFPSRL